RGPIQPGDDNRFFDLAEQAPRATVLLESPGGDVTTGLSIGAGIAIRGYATLVLDGSGCHSICAVIWVAGQRRYMSPDAKISVHAAYRMRNDANGSVEASESGAANAQIGAFLNEVGLSHDAIRYFTFAGPSDDLLQITPYVAQALSIDVALQSPNGITPVSARPTPRRITRQVSEYAGMVTNCTELFKLSGAVWKEQSRAVLKRGHEIFGGETFAPLLGEYVDATKADLRNKGTPYWCLSAERNLRNDGLATGISGPSYDCAKASTRTERAICASPDLWAADRVMASLYFYYRDSDDAYRSKEFLASQRSWLARRDHCSDDTGCLTEQYTRRLIDFGF
ncbi:MAG: hypothetical protein ABJN15_07510, partial [Parvibaculum sp.]